MESSQFPFSLQGRAGVPRAEDTRALLRLVWQRYIPNRVLLLVDGAQRQKQLAQWVPLLATVTRSHGRATAYICESYVCSLPTAAPPGP